MKQRKPLPPGLDHLDFLARLMDTRFRVPGTNIRFGLDALIGLIPGAGDLSTFAISAFMIWVMARNGASGHVLARMTLNVVIDAVIGSIPVVGDIFDVAYKANMRNLQLMQEHYQQGRHRGGAWKVVIPLLLVLFLIIAAIVWGIYSLIDSIW